MLFKLHITIFYMCILNIKYLHKKEGMGMWVLPQGENDYIIGQHFHHSDASRHSFGQR